MTKDLPVSFFPPWISEEFTDQFLSLLGFRLPTKKPEKKTNQEDEKENAAQDMLRL